MPLFNLNFVQFAVILEDYHVGVHVHISLLVATLFSLASLHLWQPSSFQSAVVMDIELIQTSTNLILGPLIQCHLPATLEIMSSHPRSGIRCMTKLYSKHSHTHTHTHIHNNLRTRDGRSSIVILMHSIASNVSGDFKEHLLG